MSRLTPGTYQGLTKAANSDGGIYLKYAADLLLGYTKVNSTEKYRWFRAVTFGVHVWYEHFRLRNSPRRTALHASMAVALGAFGLAVAANIHSLQAGTGNRQLLALALVIWPIMTGVPAFVVALAAAFGLARIRPNDKPKSA